MLIFLLFSGCATQDEPAPSNEPPTPLVCDHSGITDTEVLVAVSTDLVSEAFEPAIHGEQLKEAGAAYLAQGALKGVAGLNLSSVYLGRYELFQAEFSPDQSTLEVSRYRGDHPACRVLAFLSENDSRDNKDMEFIVYYTGNMRLYLTGDGPAPPEEQTGR